MVNQTSTMGSSTMSSDDNYLGYSIFKLMLVLMLRGGSLLVQLGTFPTDNAYNIISQNIIDIAVTVTSFVSIGFPLISNFTKLNGYFGYGTWIGSEEADIDSALTGITLALLGTHVITSLLSGRLGAKASVVIYFIFAGITLPITMQFAWGANSWMRDNVVYDTKVSFHDYAGGLVIHCAAGVVGLIGSIFLGRRVLMLKELSPSLLSVESLGTTILGYFFIFIGITAINLPSEESTFNVKLSIMNCFVVFSLSLTIFMLILVIRRDHIKMWCVLEGLQCGIATLVMLSAGIDSYDLRTCLVIAFISIFVYVLSRTVIDASPLEDYCGIIAIHAINGFISVIIPKITSSFADIHWQLFCAIIIIIFQVVVFTAVFSLLAYFQILSNENEKVNHKRALVLLKSTRRSKFSTCRRIFKVHRTTVRLHPGKDALELRSIKVMSSPSSTVSVATNTSQGNDKEAKQEFVTVDMGERRDLHLVVKERKGKKEEAPVRKETTKSEEPKVHVGEGEAVYKLDDLIDQSVSIYRVVHRTTHHRDFNVFF